MNKVFIIILSVFVSKILIAQEEPYRGGNADGHSLQTSETTFSLPVSFQPFQGGAGDGYTFITQEVPFAAPVSFQPFRGASSDGYKSDSLILFNPRAYITMYYPYSGESNDGWTSFPLFGVALPLRLLEFRGAQENNKHILFWTTAAEEQTASFGIERSADAVHFKSIGTVPASGNQDSRMQYRFTDEQPLSKNNYYRLKMQDLDGQFTYSPIVLLKRYATGVSIAVFPNPTTQSVNIISQQAGAGRSGYAQLTDMNGKVLQQKQWGTNEMRNLSFNLESYGSGMYFIRVMIEGELSIWKVMKQ